MNELSTLRIWVSSFQFPVDSRSDRSIEVLRQWWQRVGSGQSWQARNRTFGNRRQHYFKRWFAELSCMAPRLGQATIFRRLRGFKRGSGRAFFTYNDALQGIGIIRLETNSEQYRQYRLCRKKLSIGATCCLMILDGYFHIYGKDRITLS